MGRNDVEGGRNPSGRAGFRRRAIAQLAVTVLIATVLVVGGAAPVSAAPFSCSGQVFLGQTGQLYIGSFGAGFIDFQPEGSRFTSNYNALGFNRNDGYLYAVRRQSPDGNLLRIETGGAVTDLGNITGIPLPATGNELNAGVVAPDGTYYVTGLEQDELFTVDLTTVSVVATVALSQQTGAADVAFSDGLLWGATNSLEVVRVNPATGQVDKFSAPFLAGGTFGAAFTYGNGDIGVSHNSTGTLYRIRITDPASATPSIELISTQSGPSSNNNDGAECFGEADLGVVKTGPANVKAGEPVTYTMTITNHGPDPSSGWSLNDQLPAGLTNATTPTAGCTISLDGMLACTGGALAVNASTQIFVSGNAPLADTTLVNTATISANDIDNNPSNDTSTVTTTVTPLADLSVSKSGPATAVGATEVTYTLVVTNVGPNTAVSAVLTDTLPAGFTLVSASDGGIQTSPGVVTWALGDIEPSGQRTRTVTVTAPDGTAAGTNSATVTSDTEDPNPGNNTDTVTTSVTPQSDLVMDKSCPADVGAGMIFTCDLTVTNGGPSTAHDVTITDMVQSGFTFMPASSTPGFTDLGGGQIRWNVGSIASGGSATVTIGLQAPANPDSGAVNVGCTQASTPDPNDANNCETTAVPVSGRANLSTIKTGPAVVDASGQITWNVTVTNQGPSPAENVTATDTLPAGFVFQSASHGGVANSGVVTWNLGTIAAGDSIVLTVTAQAPSEGTSGTNTATVTTTTGGDDPGDNSSSISVDVDPYVDLTILKTGPATVDPDTEATYVITVTNLGPSTAENVVVEDALPPGFVFVSATGGGTPTSETLVTWNLGTMAPGEVVQVSVTVLAPSEPIEDAENVALVSTSTRELNTGNNESSTFTDVPAVADVTVAKIGASTVQAAQPITFQITVSNAGPSTATGVTVTDPLPVGFTFESASGGGVYDSVTHSVTWSIGSLPPGTLPPFAVTLIAPDEPTTAQNTVVVSCELPADCSQSDPPVVTFQVTPFSDVVLEKTGPASVPAATPFDYVLTATNNGPSTATGVVITDTLPDTVTYLADDGGCILVGVTLTCELNDLAVGVPVSITVTVLAPDQGQDVVNSATVVCADPVVCDVSDPPPVTTTITPVSTIELTKEGPARVDAGSEFSYTLTVTNFGPSDASGVVVTDHLPPEVTYIIDDQAGVELPVGTVTWDFGVLAAGESVIITVTVRAPNEPVHGVQNVATVACETLAYCPDPVQPTPVETDVDPISDLALEKIGPDEVDAGEEFTYELRVTNFGPSTATDVVVTDDLPADVTYVSDDSGGTLTGFTLSWALAPIAPSDVTVIHVTVVAPLDGADVVNSASAELACTAVTVQSHDPDDGTVACPRDPNPDNNTGSTSTTVIPVADLVLNKTSAATVNAGEQLTYTITVTNLGPSTATGVVVEDTLPGGLTYVTDDRGGVPSGNTVTWNLGSMAAGSSRTITLVTNTPGSGTGLVANQATVTGNEKDPDEDNNTGTSHTIKTATGRVLANTSKATRATLPATGGAVDHLTAAGLSSVLLGLVLTRTSRFRHKRRRRHVAHLETGS